MMLYAYTNIFLSYQIKIRLVNHKKYIFLQNLFLSDVLLANFTRKLMFLDR